MELNEVIEKLPNHLYSLIIEQPYNDYTAQDHAVWRFVMQQNVNYLSKVAHSSYLDGLKKTGINVDRIPNMYGMNRILKEIGWAAVAVDGFIPPSAFMEFQAYKVLVIAADIRPISQVEYTPAPDIIHEAAGHAPIIADPVYADHLRYFGEIGSKAFSSASDYKLYEAIRHLSIIKADPYTLEKDIIEAEQELTLLEKTLGEPSEMALIRNLHWWTVEYGLIGEMNNPKIYGAGLLSSIGESKSCLMPHVQKIPYTIDAIKLGFDITKPQPQLFVTPSFEHLNTVLDQFANNMALRRGGVYALNKALQSENLATIVYSSGLQISGVLESYKEYNGEASFIKMKGPSQICVENKQLQGHAKEYHLHGYSSPVGNLRGSNKPFELFKQADLDQYGITLGNVTKLEFESGIVVNGKVKNILTGEGKLRMLSFSDCLVKFKDETLFQPDWGIFDMAVGEKIVSAYSGLADPNAYKFEYEAPKEKTHKIEHTDEAKAIHLKYEQMRELRDKTPNIDAIQSLWTEIMEQYPNEWLLSFEVYEYTLEHFQDNGLAKVVKEHLDLLKSSSESYSRLICNAFEILEIDRC